MLAFLLDVLHCYWVLTWAMTLWTTLETALCRTNGVGGATGVEPSVTSTWVV